MPEEEKTVDAEVKSPIEQVEELKANSVSKEMYDNLQKQYNQLFKAYTERPAPQSEETHELTEKEQREADDSTYNATCKDFVNNYRGHVNNLEIAKNLVKADDYCKKYYGKSVFESETGNNTDESNIASKGRSLLDYAIENCQDNPKIFDTLFFNKLI